MKIRKSKSCQDEAQKGNIQWVEAKCRPVSRKDKQPWGLHKYGKRMTVTVKANVTITVIVIVTVTVTVTVTVNRHTHTSTAE